MGGNVIEFRSGRFSLYAMYELHINLLESMKKKKIFAIMQTKNLHILTGIFFWPHFEVKRNLSSVSWFFFTFWCQSWSCASWTKANYTDCQQKYALNIFVGKQFADTCAQKVSVKCAANDVSWERLRLKKLRRCNLLNHTDYIGWESLKPAHENQNKFNCG